MEAVKEIKTKNMIFDLDGSAADFYAHEDWEEKMYKRRFFRNLNPLHNVPAGINLFLDRHPEMKKNSYIDSAVLEENKYAKSEKSAWVAEFIPGIKRAHYLYVNVGCRKSEAFNRQLTKDDVLFDDNSKNLIEWEEDGGTSIKVINGINGKGQKFKGPRIDARWSPEEICEALEYILLS